MVGVGQTKLDMFLPESSINTVQRQKTRTVRQKLEIQTRSKTGDLVLYTWFKQKFIRDEIKIQKIIMCSSTSYSL